MHFYREKTEEYFLLDTKVENIFIHEFMGAAPEGYLKVYLMALMHADIGVSISREEIAKHLNMEEEDVLKAWNYWERMGVIRKHRTEADDHFDYDVEFISLRQHMYGQADAVASDGRYQIGDQMSDPTIKEMISKIEQTTGRVFSSSEIREVISWIEDYQMPPETVSYAFEFSRKNRKKTDIKYVGTIVRQWGSDGLRDIPAIEEYLGRIDRQNTMHKRVFQALGFPRNATEEEKRIMDSWFEDMKLPLETVLEACRKTSGISSPNINYVNKVLANWKSEGKIRRTTDPEEISQQDIIRYYEAVRAQTEGEAAKRQQEIYEQIPRIKEIDDELAGIGPELSKLIISDAVDKKTLTDRLREKEEQLRMERAFLLTDNGYEPDYTEIKHRCPHCEDTGRLENGEICQCSKEITREKIDQL